MNNGHELQRAHPGPQDRQLSPDERIMDFLDHLCAPLVGIVPYAERKAFREEAHYHIDGVVQEQLLLGYDLAEATETTLREFGEPWKIGRDFLQEWLQGTVRVRPKVLIRAATLAAFAWFGAASMITLFCLEPYALGQSRDALPVSAAVLAFFAPFVAGALTGKTSPAQAARGVRNALAPLVTHTFITGLFLLPRYEGLALAGWQLLFWLPAGRISAEVTAVWLRESRRQRFWQVAR